MLVRKRGPAPPNLNRIAHLCCLVKDYDLFDFRYNGPAYTWTNKRFSSDSVLIPLMKDWIDA